MGSPLLAPSLGDPNKFRQTNLDFRFWRNLRRENFEDLKNVLEESRRTHINNLANKLKRG